MSNTVTLYQYKSILTGDTYYGYPFGEAMEKTIEKESYIEVTTSLTRPKIHWVKKDGIQFMKKVEVNVSR